VRFRIPAVGERVSERRALVTGGAGFIGSHLVEGLVAHGWRVRVLDDLSTGREAHVAAVAGEVELVQGDVRDAECVARAVDDVGVVFHLAAMASVPRSVEDPVTTHSVNALGTLQVLEGARRAGVRRLVYAASTSVYGDSPELPKVETLPAAPLSPYALQKHTGELYCRMWSTLHDLEAVALRYFNVYGARQDPAGDYAAVIPRFVQACLAGEPPRIYGDGEQTRDFVHVSDVVRANLLAADARLPEGFAVCNVASGRATRLVAVLAEIAKQTGWDAKPVHEASRAGDIRHSHASLDHARQLLGYEPLTSLEEGLALTIAWFRQV
jgi:UDP-glucose 4-epimerase